MKPTETKTAPITHTDAIHHELNEARNAERLARTQLEAARAEVERLKSQRDNLLKPMREKAIARAERAEAECHQQAILNGKGCEREAALLGKIASLEAELAKGKAAVAEFESDWKEAERVMEEAFRQNQHLTSELAKERARFVRFIALARTWQQGINDTQRVIDSPEARHRAGVLEINRLRTVNDVRRDMLKDLLGTTKEDGK